LRIWRYEADRGTLPRGYCDAATRGCFHDGAAEGCACYPVAGRETHDPHALCDVPDAHGDAGSTVQRGDRSSRGARACDEAWGIVGMKKLMSSEVQEFKKERNGAFCCLGAQEVAHEEH